jgi:hypothetical protein
MWAPTGRRTAATALPALDSDRAIHSCHRPSSRGDFADGITSSGVGPPDLGLALAQHEAYCRTLERLGIVLERLPANPGYPDSTFVEDAAIVTIRGRCSPGPALPAEPEKWRQIHAERACTVSSCSEQTAHGDRAAQEERRWIPPARLTLHRPRDGKGGKHHVRLKGVKRQPSQDRGLLLLRVALAGLGTRSTT